MAFTYRLAEEDGTPADPRSPDGRTDVAGRGHNSARRRQDASRHRDAVRGRRPLLVAECEWPRPPQTSGPRVSQARRRAAVTPCRLRIAG